MREWIARSTHPGLDQRRTVISAKIFIGNLNYETTKEELQTLLGAAGAIQDVYLPSDRATGRPRGFAFVEFATSEEAEAAISQFNDYEMGGRKLRVNAAEDRPRRRPDFSVPDFGAEQSHDRSFARPSKPKGSRRGMRRKKRSL